MPPLSTPGTLRRWAIRVSTALLLIPALWGCASFGPPREPPLLIHHGPPVEVEPADVLALTPEMEAFLDRFVRPYESPDTRLELLARAVANSSMLGFHYDDIRTFTAAEAFAERGGNCVSYANLVIALARGAGLDAWYQEVILAPDWTSRGDTVLVPRHINVVVQTKRTTYRLDTTELTMGAGDRRQRLTDAEALGLYHSNLGAEALLQSDLSRAYGQLVTAIELAPERADPWINLGVVLGRNRQLDEAAIAYEQAIANDPDAVSALSNLYEVELTRGNLESAENLAGRVERYRRKNPYHLLHLAETAMEEHRYAEAKTLLAGALSERPNEPRFHFAMAQSSYLSGDRESAEASLSRARELITDEREIAGADLEWAAARSIEDFAWPQSEQ